MMRLVFFFLGASLLAGALASCSRKESSAPAAIHFTVARAPEWTDVFNRSTGWFGGDGIFAIPYNGVEAQADQRQDSVLFLFSDTMVGQITEGKLQPGYAMVNNSVAITHGNDPASIKFHVAGDDKNPATLFVPKTPAAQPGDYYWLGDGFVNQARDNNIYIFAYRIHNTNDSSLFPFRTVGNALIEIDHNSRFPFANQRQLDLPVIPQDTASRKIEADSFGAAVLINTGQAGSPNADGYGYIYGVRGKDKQLVAGRVKPADIENFADWQYWNGSGWTSDIGSMAAIADSVSNELSVTPLPDGRFALIYQYAGIYPQIYMQVGDTPVGPFGPRLEIWNTTNDIQDADLFTYNAKAHPAISKPGELLVSYNVNSFKFHDVIEQKPNLYRPRFVRVVFNKP